MQVKNKDFHLFKLNYPGVFEETDTEHIIELFKPTNIIVIYIPNKKRLYAWVGNHTTQSLKKHLPRIRTKFTEEYPELRVLRNIMVESDSETFEFFQILEDLGISKEDFIAHIKNQEDNILPAIQEIKSLEDKRDEFENEEKFEEAIKVAGDIIECSRKIQDTALEKEQKEKIKNYKEKLGQENVKEEIEQKGERLKQEYEELLSSNVLIEAHSLIEDFKHQYGDEYPLDSIPSLNQLFEKDQQLWEEFQKKQEEYFQQIQKKSEECELLVEDLELQKAQKLVDEMQRLTKKMSDQNIVKDWKTKIDDLEYEIEKRNFNEQYLELKESAHYADILENLGSLIIIAKELGYSEDLNQFKEKKKEIESLSQEKDNLQPTKIKLNKLAEEGLNFINKTNLSKALDVYNTIIDELEKHEKDKIVRDKDE